MSSNDTKAVVRFGAVALPLGVISAPTRRRQSPRRLLLVVAVISGCSPAVPPPAGTWSGMRRLRESGRPGFPEAGVVLVPAQVASASS